MVTTPGISASHICLRRSFEFLHALYFQTNNTKPNLRGAESIITLTETSAHFMVDGGLFYIFFVMHYLQVNAQKICESLQLWLAETFMHLDQAHKVLHEYCHRGVSFKKEHASS